MLPQILESLWTMGDLQKAHCPWDPTGQLTLSSPFISLLTISNTTLGTSALGWEKKEGRELSCLKGKQSQDTELRISSMSGLTLAAVELECPVLTQLGWSTPTDAPQASPIQEVCPSMQQSSFNFSLTWWPIKSASEIHRYKHNSFKKDTIWESEILRVKWNIRD